MGVGSIFKPDLTTILQSRGNRYRSKSCLFAGTYAVDRLERHSTAPSHGRIRASSTNNVYHMAASEQAEVRITGFDVGAFLSSQFFL